MAGFFTGGSPQQYMLNKKDKSIRQKKRGRPATGVRPIVGVRLTEAEIERIDRWAAGQKLKRSEALRKLIERGLIS
jgi:hypothetical protein